MSTGIHFRTTKGVHNYSPALEGTQLAPRHIDVAGETVADVPKLLPPRLLTVAEDLTLPGTFHPAVLRPDNSIPTGCDTDLWNDELA
jgi:hypothetical protein